MIVAKAEGNERLSREQSSRTDQDLIAAINSGDAEAFEELYRRYRDWVVRLAFRFTRDEDLALDVLQDVFVYFMKKFPGFELRCEMKSFLYPAVRNLAIGMRRKAERYVSDESALADQPSQSASPAGAAGDVLLAVIQSLPEPQREVLLGRASTQQRRPTVLALSPGAPTEFPANRFKRNYGDRRQRMKPLYQLEMGELIADANGVQLATVYPPDAPPDQVHSEQTKRGQQGRDQRGGRPPIERPVKERRHRLSPRAVEMWNAGWSCRAIGKKLGVARNTAKAWVHGKTARPAGPS